MGLRSEFLGLQELRTALFYRRLLAEAVATALLVIFGCGSALAVSDRVAPTVITITLAFGFTVSTLIWCFGHVSGCHINPSISLAMLATRKMTLTRCLAYIVVQCVGATVGAAILWGITPPHRRGTLAVTLVADEVTMWQGVGVEALATFILALTIFATCDQQRADHRGSAALSVGLTVIMAIPWSVQYTGASLNPARSLGPCVITGLWQDHWHLGGKLGPCYRWVCLRQVFWLGPVSGALLAGLLYHHVFDQRLLTANATGSKAITATLTLRDPKLDLDIRKGHPGKEVSVEGWKNAEDTTRLTLLTN